MRPSKTTNSRAVDGILRDYLRRRPLLHLDGVGDLRVRQNGSFEFSADSGPQVFIGYASEDRVHVRRLARALRAEGMRPWLDREQLMAGQNWPRAIERAISSADFAIQCFSPNSVGRRGYFHKELRLVLESATRVPLEDVFFLPVRLAECPIPERVASQFQYVDLFPDWKEGIAAIVDVIRGCRPRVSPPPL
ncbi:MAG TPA: toll/interleukin-1 receptor domain-containing protein [Bryobacteraceae bacterium]|jgi:hypothetical protein